MTPQEAKELLPIIAAYGDGETIQYNDAPKHAPAVWIDLETASFVRTPYQYRIYLVAVVHSNGDLETEHELIMRENLRNWRSPDRKTWQDFTKEVAE